MAFLLAPEFWVLVAFVLFLVLTWKPIMGRIGAALDGRAAKIKAELDEAHGLREEAQKLLADYQRKQHDAGKEAEAIIDRAKEEAKHLQREAAADLEERIARHERRATETIAQAEAAALKEVRDQTVDLAMAATARLLTESVAGERADALLDDAIKELPGRLN